MAFTHRPPPNRWRRRVDRVLKRFNLRLESIDTFRPRKELSISLLRSAGLRPATVFDVGVHRYGTPCLYETFPGAKHVLIEPVPDFRDDISRLAEKIPDAECVWAAAADYEGVARLKIAPALTHATLFDDRSDSDCEVDVITLDALTDRNGYPPPYLIKVDVDGRDIDVLKGAKKILDRTDCVILESTTAQLLPRLTFMQQQGFRLWDVVDLCYAGDPLWQVDLVLLADRFSENLPQDLERFWHL